MNSSNPTIKALLVLFDSHTKLFRNVISGISDTDAANRMGTKANHVAWIAGSLVYERYELLKAIGGHVDYTPKELFLDHKGIVDGAAYPSLTEQAADWDLLSPVLRDQISNIDEATLNGPDPMGMPGGPYLMSDTLLFCMDRESYCIGQLGLYRRMLGYEAMRYE